MCFASGRVFSSFMFHHLEATQRQKTSSEVRRVLEPSGTIHLVDFAARGSGANGPLARMLHSSHRLHDNSEDLILTLMRGAGLADPKKVSEGALLFGHMQMPLGIASGSDVVTQYAPAGCRGIEAQGPAISILGEKHRAVVAST